MTVQKTNFDVYWASPSAENDEVYGVLNNKQLINRYPNIKDLGRKDTFQNMIYLGCAIDPEAFDFVPPTFVFPQDASSFKNYAAKHKNATFIAKPESGAQGDNIQLFKDLKTVPSSLHDKMVVQRYIDEPLLLDGFKFDLRIYVVVTGINEGKINAFIADEGLVRFCTE